MDIRFDHATILTVDGEDRELSDATLCVKDGRIAYIGGAEGAPQDFAPERTIDAKGNLLMPGFVNAHTHLPMTLFRGYANDLNLQDWLFGNIIPLEDKLTAEDVYLGAMVGAAEMLLSGTTCFLDMYDFADTIAAAVEKSGLRAVLCQGMAGDGGNMQKIAKAKEICQRFQGAAGGRITTMISPHAEYTCSEEFLLACQDAAQELGVGIHVHASETAKEVRECMERHNGLSPIRYFDKLGLITDKTVLAHCVAIDSGDLETLAARGAHVAHNPGSNMKLASGFAPVPALLRGGVNVALGTDGASSNNNLDMWEEMALCALMHKGFSGDPKAIPAKKALRMATIDGARALGLEDETGSLEVGKKADLILVDTQGPRYYPRGEMVNHIVYAGHAADVKMTMVEGHILMEDGRIPHVDMPALLEAFNQAALALRAR